ncbi:MAG: lytic murein transglycosylase [Pseudomonadota bacterium]|nr:lytic murein transglycosylase [Pseudomonadota bacterium]
MYSKVVGGLALFFAKPRYWFFFAIFFFGVNSASSAQPTNFDDWLVDFRASASAAGVSEHTLSLALRGTQPLPDVIAKDRRQAEFTLSYWRYMKRVNSKRIQKGMDLLKTHKSLLQRVTNKFGVPAHYLMAFWGLESNFGKWFGGYPVIPALATLAHDGRRSKFFRAQLIAALKILDNGDITLEKMRGSWAGAMGHFQFIPTTYQAYAVDFDGDGKRDIWNNVADALASAANYLSSLGWDPKQRWGREVKLPQHFDFSKATLNDWKPLSEWRRAGLKKINDTSLPNIDIKTWLVIPAGHKGPAFAVYPNFRRIMRWNKSILYAISIGHLADRLKGAAPISIARPKNYRRVSIKKVKEIQAKLNSMGFYVGNPDGVVGKNTRSAIRDFQKREDIPADGHITINLWERLVGK